MHTSENDAHDAAAFGENAARRTPLGRGPEGAPRINGQVPSTRTDVTQDTRVPIEQQGARDELKASIHRELSKRVDFVAIAGGASDQLKSANCASKLKRSFPSLVGGRFGDRFGRRDRTSAPRNRR